MLAQIARFNPKLSYPISHRRKKVQIDLEVLQARNILVESRIQLVNHVRSSVKSPRRAPIVMQHREFS